MSWKRVPICQLCWTEEEGEREPVRVISIQIETCYRCSEPTISGIYVRRRVT